MKLETKYIYTPFVLYVFIASMFFKYNYGSIALIILCITFLVESIKTRQFKINKEVIYFVLLPIVYIFNSIYFTFDNAVVEKVSRTCMLIVFPIIFSNIKLDFKRVKRLMLFFMFCIILFCVVSIAYVSIGYLLRETRPHLLTIEKTILVGQVYVPKVFDFHTPYICLYLLVGCIICYYLFTIKKHYLYIVLYLLQLFFLFYFTGRTSLLLALVIFILFIRKLFDSSKKGIFYSVIVYTIAFAISVFFVSKLPMLKDKIINIFDKGFGLYQRQEYLIAAYQIVKEKFLLGVGLVNYQLKLSEILKSGVTPNLHNQWLEILVPTGMLGVLSYFILKIKLFQRSISQKNRMLLMFVLCFSLAELTESLLYRQRGVFLFAFFSGFLFYMPKNTS